ncbi:MAG: RES family NAD+ phosphorylase, partial [Bacteroidia bacterium]
MEVYRLAREAYALPLSGLGAAIKGARWNSAGVELFYTAMNRSLAMAEVAVHFTLATLPDDYVMMTLDIPDQV